MTTIWCNDVDERALLADATGSQHFVNTEDEEVLPRIDDRITPLDEIFR